ncbi:alpha/beta fold hydrolase [Miniimonas arenae]|uniref:alpha/beta fold hydrolase n=1 Tax=Miniimonas arenae TaxID=676201 RepID=UPI0028A9D88F|nr:alpha/beta hydrolase [Miniimonas arenae]
MAHVVLVPGLWLDASSWDAVIPDVEASGHTAIPLTLPGLEARDADRSGVSLQDQVDAVVAAVDAVPVDERVVVVGHSLGAGLVHLAVDARPERIARAVYIGGFPSESGGPLAEGFPTDGVDLPLMELSAFDDRDVADVDDDARAAFVARAIASPASLTSDVAVLRDDRRFEVPVTIICPEFSPEELQGWVSAGDLPEVAAIADVTYVDIDSGHWPQLTRPRELAALISDAASAD